MNALLLKNLNALCIRNTFTGLLSTNGTNKRSLSDKGSLTVDASGSAESTKLTPIRSAENVKKYLRANSIKNYDGWNSLLLNDYCKSNSNSTVKQNNDPSLYVDRTTGNKLKKDNLFMYY